MSAEVETMFYVKEKPWHGLGTKVLEAPTSSDALRLAGLDWTITGKPVYDAQGKEIPGYKANTRSSDQRIMGIVGSRYSIVQNVDAFAFTDTLVGEGVTYETAGSLHGGRKIWLLAKMPERTIAGDAFEPYICFVNSHDGTGAVRACMTPIRVVCNNTLNLALRGAKRAWSTPHRGDVMLRLDEARQTLQLADHYMTALAYKADQLANETMSNAEVVSALDKMLPLGSDASDRQKKTVQDAKTEIVCCMLHPDLANFIGTKWGFVNAVSDYVGHAAPVRRNANFAANRWENIMTGHVLLDRAMALVTES